MAKKLPEINPFVQNSTGFAVHAIWKMRKLGIGGGSESPSALYEVHPVDVDDRVQVYTDGLLGFFPLLNSAAKDMFIYIACKLPLDQDYLELPDDKYCKEMNVSRATFFNARKELINRIIIPRTTRKNTYWINPAYLFKGDRLNKFPESVRMMNTHPLDKGAQPTT